MLLYGSLAHIVAHTPRVQGNGGVDSSETIQLAAQVVTLITQHNGCSPSLLDLPCDNHQILVDASGGRGISPSKWNHPNTQKRVGYAGGLGPGNLELELMALRLISQGGLWADMENKLRRDNWFDTELATTVVEIFHSTLLEAKQ